LKLRHRFGSGSERIPWRDQSSGKNCRLELVKPLKLQLPLFLGGREFRPKIKGWQAGLKRSIFQSKSKHLSGSSRPADKEKAWSILKLIRLKTQPSGKSKR
jgi:hypothetical protein